MTSVAGGLMHGGAYCTRTPIRREPARRKRAADPRSYVWLVGPPVALALDVLARSVAEIGRADDQDLEALRPGLVAPPRAGRDAHRVPPLELDDLVVELHPPAPADDHVHLLLRDVRVAVREAIAGRDALVAQAGVLELERPGGQAELQVRRAVEVGPDVLEVRLEVPEREGHRCHVTLPPQCCSPSIRGPRARRASSSISRARSPGAPTASSPSPSRGRGGSSMTPPSCGTSRGPSRSRRSTTRASRRAGSKRSASTTSARPSACGTRRPASRCTVRSSGRTGGRRGAARSSRRPA